MKAGLASLAVLAILAGCSALPKHYVQTSCEIAADGSSYAIIGLTETSKIGTPGAREWDIQFEPSGLAVRFPPQYYAADWDGVDVVMTYPRPGAAEGVLSLHAKRQWIFADSEIGTVRRDCWNRMKRYIHDHVEASGVAVSLRETNG